MNIKVFWLAGLIQLVGCAVFWCVIAQYPSIYSSSIYSFLSGVGLIWLSLQTNILYETYQGRKKMKEYQKMGEEYSNQYKDGLDQKIKESGMSREEYFESCFGEENGDIWEDVYEEDRPDLANLDECFPKFEGPIVGFPIGFAKQVNEISKIQENMNKENGGNPEKSC